MLKINIDTDIKKMLFIDYMNNKSENDNDGKSKVVLETDKTTQERK